MHRDFSWLTRRIKPRRGKNRESKIQSEIYDRRRSKAVVCHMVHWNGTQSRTPSFLSFCGWGTIDFRTIINFCGIFFPCERNAILCDYEKWSHDLDSITGFVSWCLMYAWKIWWISKEDKNKQEERFLKLEQLEFAIYLF